MTFMNTKETKFLLQEHKKQGFIRFTPTVIVHHPNLSMTTVGQQYKEERSDSTPNKQNLIILLNKHILL